MKKVVILLFLMGTIIVEAKICSKGCYFSGGGYGMGYAWSIPNNQTCSNDIPYGVDVYYAYASTGGGKYKAVVFDSGVIENYSGFYVGC